MGKRGQEGRKKGEKEVGEMKNTGFVSELPKENTP